MAFFSWLRRHWSSWSRLGSAQTSATHTLQALPRPIGSPPITVMRAMSETATAATMMIAMREDRNDRGGRHDDDGFGVFRIGNFRPDKLVGTSKNDVLPGRRHYRLLQEP